jgi:hypothetical protein
MASTSASAFGKVIALKINVNSFSGGLSIKNLVLSIEFQGLFLMS